MKHALATATVLVSLILMAAPADANSTRGVMAARAYWHATPSCGEPRVGFYFEDLPEWAKAGEASCSILINSRNWDRIGAEGQCQVIVHEWGHLLHGPQHSDDPNSIMHSMSFLADFPVCAASQAKGRRFVALTKKRRLTHLAKMRHHRRMAALRS